MVEQVTSDSIRLDDVRERLGDTTAGPWVADEVESGAYIKRPTGLMIALPYFDTDAPFIAHARQDIPAMHAALTAVLEVHKPRVRDGGAPLCSCCLDPSWVGAVPKAWPCPTVRVIRAAGVEVSE